MLVVGLTAAIIDGWKAFGHRATGERRARMERSPQWQGDGHFENPQPLSNDYWAAMTAMFHASPDASPRAPVDAAPAIDKARFATPPATGLRVTWLGHSTMLIEIDGHRVLTDPVWSERASPLRLGRAQALVHAAHRARATCRRSTRSSSRTITTITSTTGRSSR